MCQNVADSDWGFVVYDFRRKRRIGKGKQYKCESAIVAEQHCKIYESPFRQVMLTYKGVEWMQSTHLSKIYYTVGISVIEVGPITKRVTKVSAAACGM